MAEADVVHSSPKTFNFCASSTVFIFTLMALKQSLTFQAELREKLLNPILNVLKKLQLLLI